MTIRVRFFARARELAGADLVTVDLPPGRTLGELRRQLAIDWPELSPLLPRCAFAVDGEFALDAQELAADAEVAVLPPVSGGADFSSP
jgi:molybdopterin synthase catalytic subunit